MERGASGVGAPPRLVRLPSHGTLLPATPSDAARHRGDARVSAPLSGYFHQAQKRGRRVDKKDKVN